jgi:hypothetical protein
MAKQHSKQIEGRTFDDITKQQIAIYAKELNDHFRNERRLRGNLQERDAMLEQRAREVSALNNLLQQQLVEWYKVAQEYREVLSTIKDVLREGMMDASRGGEIEEMINAIFDGTQEADMSTLLGV